MDPISCCAGVTGLVDLGENLIAEIDRMIDSGGKINPQEQRALGASMTAAGFSPAQRGDILAAVADFNRDGRGISGSEHKILSRLVRQRKPHLWAGALATLLTNTTDAQTGLVNACRALARAVEQSDAACR
jgi:hypothetical protein